MAVEPRRWTPWLRWVGIGWYITASILVGLLGGLWLDRTLKLMEFPLFMFLGLLLGLAAAVPSCMGGGHTRTGGSSEAIGEAGAVQGRRETLMPRR